MSQHYMNKCKHKSLYMKGKYLYMDVIACQKTAISLHHLNFITEKDMMIVILRQHQQTSHIFSDI